MLQHCTPEPLPDVHSACSNDMAPRGSYPCYVHSYGPALECIYDGSNYCDESAQQQPRDETRDIRSITDRGNTPHISHSNYYIPEHATTSPATISVDLAVEDSIETRGDNYADNINPCAQYGANDRLISPWDIMQSRASIMGDGPGNNDAAMYERRMKSADHYGSSTAAILLSMTGDGGNAVQQSISGSHQQQLGDLGGSISAGGSMYGVHAGASYEGQLERMLQAHRAIQQQQCSGPSTAASTPDVCSEGSNSGSDTAAVAYDPAVTQHKELLYRATALQPLSLHLSQDMSLLMRPKQRKNVRISKDPQSVAARHRRQRISDKMRVLQRLVPGGTKLDTASMLEEAVHYLKFLKAEVEKMEVIETLLISAAPQQHPTVPIPSPTPSSLFNNISTA